jgi:predicted Rossmann fold nucleotide-binding protein DprA/Smf involved in DNA uptake
LYYRGEVELQENLGQKPMIGIVGTRQPSEYGIRWTRQISTALAKNGFTVVSGMAEGIDTESHIAAMKAGGRTIAVLGTGVDVIYPHKNPELQTVMDAFAVGVSEVLAIEALPFDFIVQQTGMAAGSVSSALLQLELMGLVSQLPGMRYQKS